MPRVQITSIVQDVACALRYLHQWRPSPIIHRDISSANVLLEPLPNGWRAKVSDYGSANFMNAVATAAPGSPVYAAPEARHPDQHSPKMDSFSYGVLLVEMCIRRLPDPAQREAQILQIQWAAMVSLVRRCTSERPADRPSMRDIMELLGKDYYYQLTVCALGTKGYGSRFVVRSFTRSFILFTALQRAALTSSRQVRYEQAKYVDGLQSDSWILLKCFRQVLELWLAHRDWPSWTLLKTETPIVGYPDAYRFDPYCRTALGVQRDLVKSLSTLYHSLHRHLATCGIDGHAQLFISLACIACFLVNP